jgi:hypothetical protein
LDPLFKVVARDCAEAGLCYVHARLRPV